MNEVWADVTSVDDMAVRRVVAYYDADPPEERWDPEDERWLILKNMEGEGILDDLNNDLTNAERETHLNLVADNRGTWEVYTDDPVMDRKIRAAGAVFVEGDDRGRLYKMDRNQVRFFKPMSDDQKAKARERALERGFGGANDEESEDWGEG